MDTFQDVFIKKRHNGYAEIRSYMLEVIKARGKGIRFVYIVFAPGSLGQMLAERYSGQILAERLANVQETDRFGWKHVKFRNTLYFGG